MASPVDAGSIYSDVRVRLDKLQQDIISVKTGFDKLGKNIQDSSDKSTKTMTDNFKKIDLAGTAAIGAVTLAFKSAIGTFADTEQKLANVKAVSNATAEQFNELQKAANEAGTTTRFTAGQAADALFYLSSAGLNATQSVDALNGVLELAGATGSDLSQSAQAVTSTLSQFGLGASKASDVANIFAAANSNSQATLDKLQNSLRQVGPVASGLGISLEETVGSLQALYNAGFQGENAGLALKSALADLSNQASPTIQKLNALGVSFADVNPEAVGLTGAIGALEKAGLTTSETIDVFGKVAGPQLVTLIKAGQAQLEKYTEAVTGTDEAARQYAVQNDTLSGSFDALKSAVEGTSNSFIGTLSPVIRAVLGVLTNILRVTTGLPSVLKGAGAGAAAAAIGFVALSKGLALVGVAVTGSLGLVSGVGALVVALSALVVKAKEIKQQDLQKEFGGMADSLGLAGQASDEFVKKAGKIEDAFRVYQSDGIPRDLKGVKSIIDEISSSFGVTTKQVVAVGLESKKVSDEYKAQLKIVQDQITEQEILFKKQKDYASGTVTVTKWKEEQIRLDAESKRLADEKAKAEKERIDHLNAIRSQLLTIDELASKGAISEEKALKEKIKLRQDEIDTIQQQAIASGEVTASNVADIQTQQDAIDRYSTRLDELAAHEAELRANNLTDEQQAAVDRLDLEIMGQEAIADREKRISDTKKAELEQRKKDEEEYQKQVQDGYSKTYGIIEGAAKDFYTALVSLKVNQINSEISSIQTETDAQLAAIDTQTQALLKSLGLQDQTKLESLQTQLDAAIASGDTETADSLKQQIKKEKILEDAEAKKNAIQEASEKKIANLKYQADLTQWRASKLNAAIAGAEAAIQAYKSLAGIPIVGPALGIAAAAAVGIATAAQVAAIQANKPQAPQLATGGIVLPQNGGTTAVLAENGAAELALNAGSQGEALLQQFAAKVADSGGSNRPILVQLYMDGRMVAENSADYYNNGIVKVALK